MAEQAERVGKRMLEAREALDLTRAQMAGRFKEQSVTDDYIYRWETGKVMPSEGYQGSIIEHYELDGLEDLFGGPKAERKPKGNTPDVMGKMNGDVSDDQRLARIEAMLLAISDKLGVTTIPTDLRDEPDSQPAPRAEDGASNDDEEETKRPA